jgi:DNA-binding transcriptional MerR regulator
LTDPKSVGAFRTIGELSSELGLPQHILRYWETRFPQLRPVTRAGNRRYYRPEDVALVKRIDQALNRDGYTIKGVQKLLASRDETAPTTMQPQPQPQPVAVDVMADLMQIRSQLQAALADAGS